MRRVGGTLALGGVAAEEGQGLVSTGDREGCEGRRVGDPLHPVRVARRGQSVVRVIVGQDGGYEQENEREGERYHRRWVGGSIAKARAALSTPA